MTLGELAAFVENALAVCHEDTAVMVYHEGIQDYVPLEEGSWVIPSEEDRRAEVRLI